ncbi:MAG TPA: hypothetical protein V6C72_19150 [Chroococcales cyanobacterium]
MSFELQDQALPEKQDDTAHSALLQDSGFMELGRKHGGVQEPGEPVLPGEPIHANPNDVPHQQPHSTVAVSPPGRLVTA